MNTDSTSSLIKLWAEYTEWLSKNYPKNYAELNSPAAEDSFSVFKEATSYDFPRALRDLYRINNGGGNFAYYDFLPMDALISQWEANKETIDYDDPLPGSAYPANTIKTSSYNEHWVPFLHDGSGNFIGIDLDPGSSGTIGQVITFGRDERFQHVLAPSLEDYITIILQQINIGNIEGEGLEYNDEYWGIKDYDLVLYGTHLDIVEYGKQVSKIFFVPHIEIIDNDTTREIEADWTGRVLSGQTLHEGVTAEIKQVYGYGGRIEIGKVSFLDHTKDNKGVDTQRYDISIKLYPASAKVAEPSTDINSDKEELAYMPRIQIFVNSELYPVDIGARRTIQQSRVANFLGNLPAFISHTLNIPEEKIRLFAAPRGEFDQSPVDVDITNSLKIEPEEGLAKTNDAIMKFAREQLGDEISAGCHLYLLPDDAWTTTQG